MNCPACGVGYDPKAEAVYPYSGEYDGLTQDKPIPVLLTVECQPRDKNEWRMAIMCQECWHRLCENTWGIDMWISEACWETLNPVTVFSGLPLIVQGDGKWDASTYEGVTT